MKRLLTPVALSLALATPAALGAEDIYRSVMPDGRIVYGEAPFPGATQVRKVPPPQATGVITVTPAEKQRVFPTESQPSVTVVPPPKRESPQPAVQGRELASPSSLPRRGY
jgi:hypothetical protein